MKDFMNSGLTEGQTFDDELVCLPLPGPAVEKATAAPGKVPPGQLSTP
jgi:hypothetical protein